MIDRNRLIRKSIHFFTGLAVFLLTFFVEKKLLFLLIMAGTVFAFATFNYRRFRLLHRTSDASLGTLFYPLGIVTSFLLLYKMPIQFFQISLLILTVSDTAANITGMVRPGNIYFQTFKEEKSLYGVLSFAVTALLIFLILLPVSYFDVHAYVVLPILLAITFELISYKGSDNFSIPVGSALFFLVLDRSESDLLFLTAVVVLSALTAFLLFRTGLLTKNAGVAVYFMGFYLLGVMGIAWTIPLLAFFVSSVVFTMINTAVRGKKAPANRRNAWQVLANSLWALMASAGWLIVREPMLIYVYISQVAAVTADTWSSEIGQVFHRRCFSLAHFRMKMSGISGGVSVAGTVASLVGSFAISLLAYHLFFPEPDLTVITLLTASGFLASFTDSLLGAFAEEKLGGAGLFKDHMAGWTEAMSPNDVVNLLGSLSAPLILIILWVVFM